MPSITVSFDNLGPLVRVGICVSAPHRDALIKAGAPIPAPVLGAFLIDTGASCTCVDSALIAKLNLTATGVSMIQTPSTDGTPHACHEYDVMLTMPGQNPIDPPFVIDALPVVETTLKAQGIDGLLGRDVLKRCIFITNGPVGFFTLAY